MNTTTITQYIIREIERLLTHLGIPESVIHTISPLLYITVIVVISFLITWIIYRIVLVVINRIMKHKEYALLSKLIKHDVLRKQVHIIPPLIMEALLPLVFTKGSTLFRFADMAVWIYFVIMMTRAITAIISSVGDTAFNNQRFRDRPIKGFVQVAKIVVYVITTILIISIITDKSPVYLIGGLGAFAAVLMLIAKDSIMGFVGGFLLLENDMIRIGDWIEMPGNIINGTVYDISLTIVKVRNFDNTIATIPPYTLINESFINWRGMSECGGRRIARGYTIKLNTIKPCTEEFLKQMQTFDEELAAHITSNTFTSEKNNEISYATAGISTNAGLFRTYADIYLHRHPHIRKDMLIMVRTLEPTANGLPIQFYCFTTTTEWAEYENIQSQIMEHFASVMPIFDLYPYQNTSSRDTVISGMLEANFPLKHINGLPYKTTY